MIIAHQPCISACRKTLIAMYEVSRVVGRGRECAWSRGDIIWVVVHGVKGVGGEREDEGVRGRVRG